MPRRKPKPLPEPVKPVPPQHQQGWSHGHEGKVRMHILSEQAEEWRKRDNAAKRKFAARGVR